MDYSKTYTYFFDKTIRISSKFIKSYFINSKTKGRPFHTVMNEVSAKVHEVYLNDYLNALSNTYPNVINIFSKRYDYYQGENVLQFAFEDEILEEYRKIKNHAPANDTYLKLVANLAILEALNVLISRLHSHQDYLELVYELKSWENFTLANFPKGIKNSDKYLAMYQEKFTDLTQQNNSINNMDNTQSNKEFKTIQSHINDLSDNEKYFLIHLLAKQRINIPITEYIRLSILISNVKGIEMFTDNYSNTTIYKFVKEGLEYFAVKNNVNIIKREFLDGLLSKLEPFALKNVKQEIKYIKTSIKDK